MDTSQPVTALKGIGEKGADALAKLGLLTLGDLLTHFPRRHEDRTRFARLDHIANGDAVLVQATVASVENRPMRNKLLLTKVVLDDGSRTRGNLTWFNQWRMKATFDKLIGKKIVAYGVAKRAFGVVELSQPEWEPIDEDGVVDSLALGRIVPVYPLTEGVYQNRLRRWVWEAVRACADQSPETLPEAIRRRRDLPGIGAALRGMHFPESEGQREAARRRLAYEELLGLQLVVAHRRREAQQQKGIGFADTDGPVAELRSVLPFALTGAQERVIQEIGADMRAPVPMSRLVQGDVGAGKTAVAMAAMLIAARGGCQAALMAPTEILAEQHLRGVRERLEELGLRVDLLTGSRPAREKAAVKERIATGQTHVVVGTHALIQEGVDFKRLGLAVIDEQHRFGVLQRAALAGKAEAPHVLVMTATPIPRTLTLTVYGDLEVSLLDQLPPGRKPIRTHWRRSADKESVYEGVRKLLQQGRQAYVVCPLVAESEKLEAKAATALHAQLAAETFPEFTVELLHGQMPGDAKDSAMARFRKGEAHVLVATTVIEVGVDVPNAAVMVIEDADRFGLAQLHQLRGRVGRGEHASFCVLVADPKTPDGEARMRVMASTGDGFKIAEEDLILRGPGEFFGTRQSGMPPLKVADVLGDTEILKEAREDALDALDEDPQLARPENRLLRAALTRGQRAVEYGAAS